tara:strand:- start:408 stop:938 length:531 start_codon:yes stop_codon:yes gene_type:complete
MVTLKNPNYISPSGFSKLRRELSDLIKNERPKVLETVAWAASNGDRSENGDYIYGKKRLREIDRRIRFLTKTIESVKIVDPRDQVGNDQVFFGATVKYRRKLFNGKSSGKEHSIQDDIEEIVIVGVDETNFEKGHVSWISPIAKALLKSRVGDETTLRTPSGLQRLEILSINYNEI